MSVLREEVLLQMRLRGFAVKTVEAYIHAMEQLWQFYRRSLERLSCEEVQRFLDEIIKVRKLSWSTVNVYFSACRFLYEQVLKQPVCKFSIPPRGIKHRAILAMTYGSGLRVSEVVRVKISDVDRGRMMLRVEQSKGHKDRYTVLSLHALKLLEDVWHQYHPAEFFFTGFDRLRPLSIAAAQAVYYTALTRSGVRRVGGIHVLRHCFATHLMEAGVDVYTIKHWMGHGAVATTGRYMHVTAEHLAKAKSPLDIINKE